MDPPRPETHRLALCQPVWITGKVLPQLAYVGRSPLQQAILAALSSAMSDKDHLVHQITNAMQLELIQDSQSRTSLGMIERRLTELENQFQHRWNWPPMISPLIMRSSKKFSTNRLH